jgi:hypothetical protein
MTINELWPETLHHLSEGNFTALEHMLGGPVGFDQHMTAWLTAGKFDSEPEMLAEALSCACMLGRTKTAEILLDKGVVPYSGMKTGLAGPHYAVSGGHSKIVRMLIERSINLEVENSYGGTMLGQALWSFINEHKPNHAEIIEMLIAAGAKISPGTIEWWEAQNVPSPEKKRLIGNALKQHENL